MSTRSVRCQACGGVFDTHEGVCTYCGRGVRFAGLGLPATSTTLPCPRCTEEAKLYEVEYRGVRIDVCPRCEGSWYDVGEIEVLVNKARDDSKAGAFDPSKPTRPSPPPSGEDPAGDAPRAVEDVLRPVYIRCPHCNQVMGRKNWESRSGILVDFCTSHGVWLDGGELQRVRAWSARNPDGPPPPLQGAEPPKAAASSFAGGSGFSRMPPSGPYGQSGRLMGEMAEAGGWFLSFLGRLLIGR